MPNRIELLCVGRVGADFYSRDIGVPLADVSSFNFFVGGTPANVAVGAQRLGVGAALASVVGADGIGDGILRFLDAEGVDTTAVRRDPTRRSGLVVLGVEPPDNFPLVFYRDNPADETLTPSDLDGLDVSTLAVVFVAGTNLLRRSVHATTLAAIEIAQRQGASVVFDIDYRPALWSNPNEFGVLARSVVANADVVIGTEEEMAAVGGEELITELVGPRGGVVVCKRGERGSEVVENAARQTVPPFPVKVTNLFGAGDAFAAGYISGMISGQSPVESARRGNAAGAHVVTHHACANDMPSREELAQILGSVPGQD